MLRKYGEGGMLRRVIAPVDYDRLDLSLSDLYHKEYPKYVDWLTNQIDEHLDPIALPPDFYYDNVLLVPDIANPPYYKDDTLIDHIILPPKTSFGIQRISAFDNGQYHYYNVEKKYLGRSNGALDFTIVTGDEITILSISRDASNVVKSFKEVMKIVGRNVTFERTELSVSTKYPQSEKLTYYTSDLVESRMLCFNTPGDVFYPSDFESASKALLFEARKQCFYLFDRLVAAKAVELVQEIETNPLDAMISKLLAENILREKIGGVFKQFVYPEFDIEKPNMRGLPFLDSTYGFKLVTDGTVVDMPSSVPLGLNSVGSKTDPKTYFIDQFVSCIIEVVPTIKDETVIEILSEVKPTNQDRYIKVNLKMRLYRVARISMSFVIEANDKMGLAANQIMTVANGQTKIDQPTILTENGKITVNYLRDVEELLTDEELEYVRVVRPTQPGSQYDIVVPFDGVTVEGILKFSLVMKTNAAPFSWVAFTKTEPLLMNVPSWAIDSFTILQLPNFTYATKINNLAETISDKELYFQAKFDLQDYQNSKFEKDIANKLDREEYYEIATSNKTTIFETITGPLQILAMFNVPARVATVLNISLALLTAVENVQRGEYMQAALNAYTGLTVATYNLRKRLGVFPTNQDDMIKQMSEYDLSKVTMIKRARDSPLAKFEQFPRGIHIDNIEIRSNNIKQLPGAKYVADWLNSRPESNITKYMKTRMVIPEHHYVQTTSTTYVEGVGNVTQSTRLGIADGVNSSRGDFNIKNTEKNSGKLPSQPGVLYHVGIHENGKFLPYKHEDDTLLQHKATLAQLGAKRSDLLTIDSHEALEKKYGMSFDKTLSKHLELFDNVEHKTVQRVEHTTFPTEHNKIIGHFTQEPYKQNWHYNITNRNCQGYAKDLFNQLQGFDSKLGFNPAQYERGDMRFLNFKDKVDFQFYMRENYENILGFAPGRFTK